MVSYLQSLEMISYPLNNWFCYSLTPVKTILDAYRLFLEDDTGMAGEVLECSADKLIFYNLPEMGNGHVTKRAVTVWEPLFRQMHGEDSQLPDAIP